MYLKFEFCVQSVWLCVIFIVTFKLVNPVMDEVNLSGCYSRHAAVSPIDQLWATVTLIIV